MSAPINESTNAAAAAAANTVSIPTTGAPLKPEPPRAWFDEATKEFVVRTAGKEITIKKLHGVELDGAALERAGKVDEIVKALGALQPAISEALKGTSLPEGKISFVPDYTKATVTDAKGNLVKDQNIKISDAQINEITRTQQAVQPIFNDMIQKARDTSKAHQLAAPTTTNATAQHAIQFHSPAAKQDHFDPQQSRKEILDTFGTLNNAVLNHLEANKGKPLKNLGNSDKIAIQNTIPKVEQYIAQLEDLQRKCREQGESPESEAAMARISIEITEMSQILTFLKPSISESGLDRNQQLDIINKSLNQPQKINPDQAKRMCKILEPIVKGLEKENLSNTAHQLTETLKEHLKQLQNCRDGATDQNGQYISKFSYTALPARTTTLSPPNASSSRGAASIGEAALKGGFPDPVSEKIKESEKIRNEIRSALSKPPPDWKSVLNSAVTIRALQREISNLQKDGILNIAKDNETENEALIKLLLVSYSSSFPASSKLLDNPDALLQQKKGFFSSEPTNPKDCLAALNYSLAKAFLEYPIDDPKRLIAMQKAKSNLQSFEKNFPGFVKQHTPDGSLLQTLSSMVTLSLQYTVPDPNTLRDKIYLQLNSTQKQWNTILQDAAKLRDLSHQEYPKVNKDIVEKMGKLDEAAFDQLVKMSGRSYLPIGSEGQKYIDTLKVVLTKTTLGLPNNVEMYNEARAMLHKFRRTHPNFYKEQLAKDPAFAQLAGKTLLPQGMPTADLDIIESAENEISSNDKEVEIRNILNSGDQEKISSLFKSNPKEAHAVLKKTLAMGAFANPIHLKNATAMLANIQRNCPSEYSSLLSNHEYKPLILTIRDSQVKQTNFDDLPKVIVNKREEFIQNVQQGKLIGIKLTDESLINARDALKDLKVLQQNDFPKGYEQLLNQFVQLIEGERLIPIKHIVHLANENQIPSDKRQGVYEGMELIKYQLQEENVSANQGLIKDITTAQQKLKESGLIDEAAVKERLDNFKVERDEARTLDQLSQNKIKESTILRETINTLLNPKPPQPIPFDKIKQAGALLKKHENDLQTLQEIRNEVGTRSETLEKAIKDNIEENTVLSDKIFHTHKVNIFDSTMKLTPAKKDDLIPPSMKDRLAKQAAAPSIPVLSMEELEAHLKEPPIPQPVVTPPVSPAVTVTPIMAPPLPPEKITETTSGQEVALTGMNLTDAQDVFNYIVKEKDNTKYQQIGRSSNAWAGQMTDRSMLGSAIKIARFKDLTPEQAKAFLPGYNALIKDFKEKYENTSDYAPLKPDIESGLANLNKIAGNKQ